MIAPADSLPSDQTVIANLKRIMQHHNLTHEQVVECTGIDARTLLRFIRGEQRPHAKTIHKLATGLGIDADELFKPAAHIRRRFDRASNQLVDVVVAEHPDIFLKWSDGDYDELYSQFGVGGQLTESGVLATARNMNSIRELKHMFAVIMQSSDAEFLALIVRELYRRVTVRPALPGVPK